MRQSPTIAIVGATGAVGAEFLGCIERRNFPVGTLRALASARSAGKTVDFRGQKIVIEELVETSFDGVDIALFSAGGSISKKFAPIAVKAGAVVVDNSSAFRMDTDVPLVIPEINARRIKEHKGIIAKSELRSDYRFGAAVADPSPKPHQAADPCDLPGSLRRGRSGYGGVVGVHSCISGRPALSAKSVAASLCLQSLQPQHGDRSRHRLQRRRDQGHQGDQEDF